MESQEYNPLNEIKNPNKLALLIKEFSSQAERLLLDPRKSENLGSRLALKTGLLMVGNALLIPTTRTEPGLTIFAVHGGLLLGAMGKGLKDSFLHDRRTLKFGKHMTVTVGKLREQFDISDNTNLKTGEIVGNIDFINKLPRMESDTNLVGFVRYLFQSAKDSLQELADHCRENDPRLEGVRNFVGVSHLAGPLAERLGFSTFEITDKKEAEGLKYWALRRARAVAGKNEEWKKYGDNFKSPRIAVISREDLLKAFPEGSPKE